MICVGNSVGPDELHLRIGLIKGLTERVSDKEKSAVFHCPLNYDSDSGSEGGYAMT